jgi:hypothetical protein
MIKAFVLLALILMGSVSSVSAVELPNRPVAPTPPPIPEVPERSGVYSDPAVAGIQVYVFVHDRKLESATASICTDPDSSSVVNPAGWKLPAATLTYKLNQTSVPTSVGGSNLPAIASTGFEQWTNAVSSSVSKPTLVRGANTNANRSSYDKQNIIAWGRTSPSALGVTYVRYYTGSGVVVDVDTIMNGKVAWSWNGINGSCGNPNSYDAQNILTHELGHWMGLDDEYGASYQDNTMFGYGSKNETKKDTLTSGDISGVRALYP